MLGLPTLLNVPNFIKLRIGVASCYANGSLSFIFMPISQNSRNIVHSVGQAATFTVANRPPHANNARVALMGNVTVMYPDPDGDREVGQLTIDDIESCFLERHPDAKCGFLGESPHILYVDVMSPPFLLILSF
jgi:hypothetical protein